MVLEHEVAAFELASLELAGGLYANDCGMATACVSAFDARVATVKEGFVSASGFAVLALEGQLAGTLQADMNCFGASTVAAQSQAVGNGVATIQGQSITSLSLQAYSATLAQIFGASSATYAGGAYASTMQQSFGQGLAAPIGQSVHQSTAFFAGNAFLAGNGQGINLSRLQGQGSSSTALLFNAYGDQRLNTTGLTSTNLASARVREAQHAIAGSAICSWQIGAFANTAISDAEGTFEVADFELAASELGGEAIRYGASRAEMICFGQATAKSDFVSTANTEVRFLPAYALQAAYAINAATQTDFKFSVYLDSRTQIYGDSIVLYEAPNARLFRLLPHAYDTSARAYESRGTLRPFETRGVKRPWEQRDIDLSAQPRTVSWS